HRTMSGNTIGRLFTVTTFGESHGPAMGCIVDGCPPGLPLSEADLQQDVDRRRTGTSHFVSQRRDRKSTRLNSSHVAISYAVFCYPLPNILPSFPTRRSSDLHRTMSGNTIGRLFTVTTFGESHGPAMGCIVDGCPPGLPLSEADLQQDVDRRRTGTSHFVSQRREADQVRILSGVFEGHTTGTPIGILIENTDARSRDYDKIKDRFRPGHADYTYQQKYGVRDYRGGGRSSARETVMRTAAGAIARRYLAARLGVRIYGYLSQVGSLSLEPVEPAFAYQNPFFCPDPARIAELEELIWKVRGAGDSIGARVTVVASGVPAGLGEPVFDRLDADIAHAL